MILNIKVKDEDDLKLDTNNIKDEEFSIYTYSEKQLKSICKTLFDIIGNNEISTEDEKECHFIAFYHWNACIWRDYPCRTEVCRKCAGDSN